MNRRPSTLNHTTQDKPIFDKDKRLGKYERLPVSSTRKAEAGLRLKNIYKKNTPGKPLVTYITIVRNNKKGILRCMESVWNQTYDNIEYIVIDGCSTDGTTELILDHSEKIDYFVSESDTGIYNAFNKALQLATGEFINFINSDDCLYDNAAEHAVSSIKHEELLFGAATYYDELGNELYLHTPFKMHEGTVFVGTPVCHNAVYARKSAFEKIGYFREDFHIAADFNWLLNGWKENLTIAYNENAYVKYSLGGASDNFEKYSADVTKMIKERHPSLLDSEISVIIKNFCMFLPANVMSSEEKHVINQVITKNKDNSQLTSGLLHCFMAKTYQYDQLIHAGGNGQNNSKLFYAFKEKVKKVTKNTFLYKPLKRVYLKLKSIKRG